MSAERKIQIYLYLTNERFREKETNIMAKVGIVMGSDSDILE